MSWMNFITIMTDHLAWPVSAIILTLLLRNNISNLIPRITRVKHKDTEIDFTKAIEDIVDKAEEIEDSGRTLTLELKSEEDRLVRKIDISPHAVVHNAYNVLDRELLEVYDSYLKGDARKRLTVRDAREIRKKLGFTSDIEKNISKLRRLRTLIMNNRKLDLTYDQVMSYIELALDTTMQVRSFVNKK